MDMEKTVSLCEERTAQCPPSGAREESGFREAISGEEGDGPDPSGRGHRLESQRQPTPSY